MDIEIFYKNRVNKFRSQLLRTNTTFNEPGPAVGKRVSANPGLTF